MSRAFFFARRPPSPKLTLLSRSRLEDHRHHVSDVLVGSVIGIIASSITYLVYFPSPFASSSLGNMHLPRLVYSKALPSEGSIQLEDEDEDKDGLLGLGGRGDSMV